MHPINHPTASFVSSSLAVPHTDNVYVNTYAHICHINTCIYVRAPPAVVIA